MGIAFLCCFTCSLAFVIMCIIDSIKNAPVIEDDDESIYQKHYNEQNIDEHLMNVHNQLNDEI